MDNSVINELNAVFKGEQMAVEAYERLIYDLKDETVKKELQDIQKDHRRHASELADRIQTLGGKAEYGTGVSGLMADMKMAVQNASNNHDTLQILKQAYDGEDKGIAKVEEIIKGDLDDESLSIVKKLLSEDHEHLKKMAHMMANFES
ncbi:MAG: PA2169 family four-helix-bundle protein [Clostridia bacterium]|nr:PA2169 family four-helix-bundle protein [Clostridia bacterium]